MDDVGIDHSKTTTTRVGKKTFLKSFFGHPHFAPPADSFRCCAFSLVGLFFGGFWCFLKEMTRLLHI